VTQNRKELVVKRSLISLVAALAVGSVAVAQSVTIWTTLSDQSLEWLQQETTSFSESFGVDVEIVKLALGELREQTLLSAPEGQAGDLLVGVPHDQIGEMAVGGVLADMSSFATDNYLADLSEQARLAYTFGGKLFGLPMFVEGPALIVNTDLVPQLPATYEEMIAVAQDLTTSDTFGFMYDINNFYYSYNWIHSYGGYVFGRDATGDFDPGDVGLANEGAVRGASELQALRHEHGLIPAGTDYNVANGLFIDGALAMVYDGPWAIPGFRDAGIQVQVVPMPPREDGSEWSGFMGVQGVLLNQFSTVKVHAANLAKWLVRPDAQVALANLSGRIPASDSAVAQVSDDPIVAGFGAALQNSEPMVNIPEMGRVWQPMANALSVITESATANVANALEQAVQEIRGE
jgi:arabinogalactan oligomer/maltooligosaccharide transport system substrate-binding protein